MNRRATRTLIVAASLFASAPQMSMACDIALLPKDPDLLAARAATSFRDAEAIAEIRTIRTRHVHLKGYVSVSEVLVVDGFKGVRTGEKLRIYNSDASGDCSHSAPEAGQSGFAALYIDGSISPGLTRGAVGKMSDNLRPGLYGADETKDRIDPTPWLLTPIAIKFEDLRAYRDRWMELEQTAKADRGNSEKWKALATYLHEANDLRNAMLAYSRVLEIEPSNAAVIAKLADIERRFRVKGAYK